MRSSSREVRQRLLSSAALVGLLVLAGNLSALADANTTADTAWENPRALLDLQTPAPSGRVVVKFAAEAGVSVGAGGLICQSDELARRLDELLARIAPGAFWERRFSRSPEAIRAERMAAETRSGRSLPDLNLYAQLSLSGPREGAQWQIVLRQLMADPAVVTAFLEPVAVPAALGFDAFTGATPAVRSESGAPQANRLPTPDFSDMQGYLDDAPGGIGAWAVAEVAGARGDQNRVLDIEGAWL